MKPFILMLLGLFTFTALAADSTPIHPGDLAIRGATGEIVSVRLICPPPKPGEVACAQYGSIVTVKVTLKGCRDRLGGYFTHFTPVKNKGRIYFGANDIQTYLSELGDCEQGRSEIIRVTLPYEGEFELVNLGYSRR